MSDQDDRPNLHPQVLFVYGTFRPEDEGSPRNLADAKRLGEGKIPGVMFHLGGFPGVKPLEEIEGQTKGSLPVEDPHVVGDILDYRHLDYEEWKDQLATCDAIEGHPRLFERRKTRVHPINGSGDEILAWCYFYNREIRSETPIITGGNWLERTPRTTRF